MADEGAKAAAKAPLVSTIQMAQLTPSVTVEELAKAQTKAVPAERQSWKSAGAEYRNWLWYGPNGRPCLPKCLFPAYAIMTHGKDHVSKGGMFDSIDRYWYTQGFSNYAQKCLCQMPCVHHKQYVLDEMRENIEELHKRNAEIWDPLGEWLGNIGSSILKYVLYALVILLLVLVFISCVKRIVTSCCKATETMMMNVLVVDPYEYPSPDIRIESESLC